MEIFYRLCFVLVLIFIVSLTTTTGFPTSSEPEPPIKVIQCPQNSVISPCFCHMDPFRDAYLDCSGSAVNQSSIETAFREIRRINKIPEDRDLSIYEFDLVDTEMTQLDLAPFYKSHMHLFYMHDNPMLTQLVTSGDLEDQGSIHAEFFELWSAPLKKAGFGDALKYFSNEMTFFSARHLDLGSHDDNENSDDDKNESEFPSGLSGLSNLKLLYMINCSISGRLSSDTLIPKELNVMTLNSNNITKIGENVFDFDGSGGSLSIGLSNNKLNETGFHPNAGIARPGRRTTLYLEENQIRTLPAPIFEPFLDAHVENSLRLGQNPLICDERLSWIKSRREEFQKRVEGADCSNDQGHTIFDSDLIP